MPHHAADPAALPDRAALAGLPAMMSRAAAALEQHAGRERYDTEPYPQAPWREHLDIPLPQTGWGAERVVDALVEHVVPHGIPADAGGFTGWVFSSPPVVPTVARTVVSRVGAQRYLLFAPSLLEGVALRWLREMFGLDPQAEGVFTPGGSSANIVGIGAARQRAYEQVGLDPARDGLAGAPLGTVYGSTETHHCLLKSAGALGLGRSQVRLVRTDERDRVDVAEVARQIRRDRDAGLLPVAVVANAGTTNTGAIDPIDDLLEVCRELDVWLHVDGAYGLPGLLDPRVASCYDGLAEADSVVTDLHKWLNVPTGTGVTYVREQGLLGRAFTMEPSDYIEGQFSDPEAAGSAWDAMGPPYNDWALELSAPALGAVVWATLAEIGVEGFAERVVRHRDLARLVHDLATEHPRLESLLEPELSVACLRYVGPPGTDDLDLLNGEILARLRREGRHAPSGTTVRGAVAIRPCFVSAWNTEADARGLVEAVAATGDALLGG